MNNSAPRRRLWIVLVFLVGSIILLPACLLGLVFPWLAEPAFRTVEEIPIDQIDELRIEFLNHPERKPDIGPVVVKPSDYAKLLQTLLAAEPINSIPPSPFLGEIRIRLKSGGRGTIRFRFQPSNIAADKAPVWFDIGGKKYKAGTLGPLWASAAEAEAQAKK